MAEAERKPDLPELVGRAMNSSVLRWRDNVETPLERIAAVGAAGLAVKLGADYDLAIGAMDPELIRRSAGKKHEVNPAKADSRALAADLASELLHLREAGQLDALPRAADLFAAWLSERRRMGVYSRELLSKFAVIVLHEMLSPHCPKCRGSCREELSRGGQWIVPQGRMRNPITRRCEACHGSGRPLPRHPERTKALGIAREQYDSENWPAHFNAASGWVRVAIPALLLRALTAELGRRKRRPHRV